MVMDTAPLKSFATWARAALIREVTARIAAVLAPGSSERVEQAGAVAALQKAVTAGGGGDKGRAAVADKVAYTWFNRIIALRFMDANGYTGIGVVSPQAGVALGQPEILAEAKRGVIDAEVVSPSTGKTVAALLDGTRASGDPQGEAYALLLEAYGHYWHKAMPFMFEREGDFTELLIPANLLADDSVLNRSVKVLTAEVCRDVEVIGWLYQFYISERKDEVFAGFKKNQKAGAAEIPAATQLFTPHWIVRYLVENSLGRLWMLNRPSSRLVERMEYYIDAGRAQNELARSAEVKEDVDEHSEEHIAPVDEETDFLEISKPEELKVIDPACGSGHMLTYAFDLLYAIYEEEGYGPAEIPGLILTHNLYGTEIDPRAGALAAFALTMKARARQRTFFSKEVESNICVIEPISFGPAELEFLVTRGGERHAEEAFWNQFEHADILGSLIQPDADLTARLGRHLETLDDGGDLLKADVLAWAKRVVTQAEYLSPKYVVVVANPPYMGSKNMGAVLAEFIRKELPCSKADLFAAFIERSLTLGRPGGLAGLVTMHSWMFLSSFEKLRDRLLSVSSVAGMAHLGTRAFDSIGGAVVATTAFVLSNRPGNSAGTFVRLVDGENEAEKRGFLLQASSDSGSSIRYERTNKWFRALPGVPISYWLSDGLVRSFARDQALVDVATPRQGLATTDNGRFLRRWSEVSIGRIGFGLASRSDAEESGRKWFPYNKGGTTRRWYGNHDFVVNWQNDGYEIKETIIRKYPYLNGNPSFVAKNTDYYFRPSISWSLIGTGAPSFRYYPQGFVFDVAGTSVFPNHLTELEALLGYLNSGVTEALLGAIAPTMNLVGGDIARIPVPDLATGLTEVTEAVSRLVALTSEEWDSTEASWMFRIPPVLRLDGTLTKRVSTQIRTLEVESAEILDLEAKLDEHFSVEMGLDVVPLRGADIAQGGLQIPDTGEIVLDLVSYAVGCMFGRYSLDEPGLILADQGATLQDYLAKVPEPSFTPDADNVIPIVDGDWFEDDIVERFRQFLRVAFGDQHFEENLRFVTESLGVKNLRDYFVKSFYKDHVKRYKKRPIYWLFSSPKGSFNALIYLHRYTPSTVSTVLNEYLREFQAKLRASLNHAERSNDAKDADRLRKILLELDEYEHDVLYPLASQNIAIDLDDGVKVNYPKFYPALKKIPGLEASGE